MANLLVKGAAFPGSPSSGDPFFRDDIGLWCFYDGTRWLTQNVYTAGRDGFAISVNTNSHIEITQTDYAVYYININLVTKVATTNDGSNYWTCDVRSYNEALGSYTDIYTVDTSSDSVDTWTSHSGTPTTQNPANYGHVYINSAKTSSPGAMTINISAEYRLIIT